MNLVEKSLKFVEPKMTFSDEIRFTPYAWAKLIWIRDRGPTEVAGYGITETEDPLLITDFVLVKQECTSVSFDLDQEDSVEYMERMMDKGLMPWQCSNILIHTHPGDSPNPSQTDEINFQKAFTHPHWAVMFILADSGKTYCRLKLNVGPGITKELKVSIQYNICFSGTDIESWKKEYESNITEVSFLMAGAEVTRKDNYTHFSNQDDPLWWNEDEQVWESRDKTLEEVQHIPSDEDMEEIECHWDTDGNVSYWDCDDDIWYIYDPLKEEWYKENFSDEMPEEIEKPNRPWADTVIFWANQYANKRVLSMEN